MLNALAKLASLSVLALIGVVGLLFYRHLSASQAQIEELQTLASERQAVIERLSAEKRVAEFIVADQKRVDGKLITTLFMVEHDAAGNATPARSFTVVGERVHLDALVIKFSQEEVQQPQGRQALLLLEKVYGDAQVPADAPRIDRKDQVPSLYRNADPKRALTEQPLWEQFWQLSQDDALRRQHGVKMAHGSGVFVEPKAGMRYTVTLQVDGNVTIYNEPLPALFDSVMKHQPVD